MNGKDFEEISDKMGLGFRLCMRVGKQDYELSSFSDASDVTNGLRKVVHGILAIMYQQGTISKEDWNSFSSELDLLKST